MDEQVVAAVMNRAPVTVVPGATFKNVVGALLATDTCAVPVLDSRHRPIGTITELDLLANLEFHGRVDPAPWLGGGHARHRWRKSSALTAAELMTTPAAVLRLDARLSIAARRLNSLGLPLLSVVDADMRLVGVLTPRDLLGTYRRPDNDIETAVRDAIRADLQRPTRDPAPISLHVCDGIVTLAGVLTFRSRVEHATYAVSRIPGVVATNNHLTYELDDLMVTGF